MTEKLQLEWIIEKIHNAYTECGPKFIHDDVLKLLQDIKSGDFFKMEIAKQVDILNWFEQAYLGRGERIFGLIYKNLLPENFASEMQIALWKYYLCLDISEETKKRISLRLASILAKQCE